MDEQEILAALRAHVAREQSTVSCAPVAAPAAAEASYSYSSTPSNTGGSAPGFSAPFSDDFSAGSDIWSEPVPGPAPPRPPAPCVDRSVLEKVAAEVRTARNEVGKLNPRNRGLLNGLAQTVKKVVQRLLSWYTRSLQDFNGSVADAIEEHGRAIDSIQDQMSSGYSSAYDHALSIDSRINSIHHLIASARNQAISFQSKIQDQIQSQSQTQSQIQNQVAQLRNDVPAIVASAIKADNARWRDILRTAELATQEQQSPYGQLFRGLAPVLDLGCGRGEFLELMKELGVDASGVDSDRVVCEAARHKHLKVVDGDLLEYLQQLPERSLGGIFSARVIEYLPSHLHAELIACCSRKLKPHGLIVIETLNPDSNTPFGRNLHIDPSHLRTVYPETLKSMLDANGFQKSKICILAPQTTSVDGVPCPTDLSDPSEPESHLAAAAPAGLSGAQAYAAIAWR